MKKLLIMALLVGVLISLFSQTREFYYVSALLVLGAVFFSLKKWSLSLTDMLVLFLITVPLHTLRFGSEEHFIRLSEIAFIPLFLWWLYCVFGVVVFGGVCLAVGFGGFGVNTWVAVVLLNVVALVLVLVVR